MDWLADAASPPAAAPKDAVQLGPVLGIARLEAEEGPGIAVTGAILDAVRDHLGQGPHPTVAVQTVSDRFGHLGHLPDCGRVKKGHVVTCLLLEPLVQVGVVGGFSEGFGLFDENGEGAVRSAPGSESLQGPAGLHKAVAVQFQLLVRFGEGGVRMVLERQLQKRPPNGNVWGIDGHPQCRKGASVGVLFGLAQLVVLIVPPSRVRRR